jgi:hypothetical protein
MAAFPSAMPAKATDDRVARITRGQVGHRFVVLLSPMGVRRNVLTPKGLRSRSPGLPRERLPWGEDQGIRLTPKGLHREMSRRSM